MAEARPRSQRDTHDPQTHNAITAPTPHEALLEVILPAIERGRFAVAPGVVAPDTASTSAFIEAYSHDRETHTHYEWMWLLSGEGHMKINGQVYRLKAGDFCLLPPLVPHADVYDRSTPAYSSLWFIYSDGVLRLAHFTYRPFGRQNVKSFGSARASDEVGRVLLALQSELAQQDGHTSRVVRGLLLQLAALLLRVVETQGERGDVHGAVSSRVMEFLQQNYARDLSLQEIARSAFLTPNYLSSLFKQETGQTIRDALAQIRIEHAARLLIEKQMPLAAIAEAVGYHSVDRFSRVFRRLKGVAPKYYGK